MCHPLKYLFAVSRGEPWLGEGFQQFDGHTACYLCGNWFQGHSRWEHLICEYETIWPAFVARHLLWVSHLYSWSCFGFVLYTSALWFVKIAEVVFYCLNWSLVVQPSCYTSLSSTYTGSLSIVVACNAVHAGMATWCELDGCDIVHNSKSDLTQVRAV